MARPGSGGVRVGQSVIQFGDFPEPVELREARERAERVRAIFGTASREVGPGISDGQGTVGLKDGVSQATAVLVQTNAQSNFNPPGSLYPTSDNTFSNLFVPQGLRAERDETSTVPDRPNLAPQEHMIHSSDLKGAISSQDSAKTRQLLARYFPQVAVGEYSWLMELTQLGYSTTEIADVLLEKSLDGPWIFGAFKAEPVSPFIEDFHVHHCVHGTESTGDTSVSKKINEFVLGSAMSTNVGSFNFPVRETVQYFCGLGGVHPDASGLNQKALTSVSFMEENSTAIVSLSGQIPSLSDSNRAPEVLNGILQSLEFAASVLQQVGGCCNSFTVLFKHGSVIEMQRVELAMLRRFHMILGKIIESYDGTLSRKHLWSQLCPLVGLDGIFDDIPPSFIGSHIIYVCSLVVQFLSLAMLSYAQAHCGAVRPFFLDTPQKRVVLVGSADNNSYARMPCIVGSLVELSCMGDMIGQPVFAFQYFPQYEEAFTKDRPSEKFDLVACAEDLLDTWGPGKLIADKINSQRIFAIFIGGGIITANGKEKKADQPVLHWSCEKVPRDSLTLWFDRRSKIRVGTLVAENPKCKADIQAQIENAVPLLQELGTFPSYWEVSERQIGLGVQGGQSVVGAFQFNQTWIKMPGHTKKSAMLAQQAVYTGDLESPFGVQVSLCTGIARRVRLRELLADVLPAYISALVTKPPLWKALNEDFHVLRALRGSNLNDWLIQLDHDHQRTFENLVLAVLLLLQGTGVDRKGQNFVIACTQPNLPFQCFKVPCTQESYWARMLADSEEIATFAYITTKCLETTQVQCRGPAGAWANSTGLLWTAVSCYQDRATAATSLAPATQWSLKDSEAYLIGKPDAPLFVRVDRPNNNEEPRLLVSSSTIPAEYLYRLYLKGKPRRLREKKALDQFAESVIVLVKKHGKP